MKLHIENFAKIKEADITIDGITVLAGENNTGKSTIGKIVFSIFNTLSNVNEKVFEDRLSGIEKESERILNRYSRAFKNPLRSSYVAAEDIKRQIRETFVADTENEQTYSQIVKNSIEKILKQNSDKNTWTEVIEEVAESISDVMSLSDILIIKERITIYFGRMFNYQIQPLNQRGIHKAVITLEIQGGMQRIGFENNNCTEFDSDFNIAHQAIYIDDPFVMDELSAYSDKTKLTDIFLKQLLLKTNQKDVMEGVVESVRAKEKLADIYKKLAEVVDGDIIVGKNGEFYLKNGNFENPVSFNNLSTGIKSFLILKMLLENGCIKEKDVVILDEPEIHLHPQWQIFYAELIVLLQKSFDLSVIVTSHSPYFIDAIHLFSCKYGIEEKVNYYLSSNVENVVRMDCVTDNLDLIYKKMASPIQLLETLRYELNNAPEEL